MLARLRRLVGVLACVLLLLAAGSSPARAWDATAASRSSDSWLRGSSDVTTGTQHHLRPAALFSSAESDDRTQAPVRLTGPGPLSSGVGDGSAALTVRFPSAPETPSPSAPAAPSAPSQSATAQPVNQRSDSSGTIVALVAAALLAVIAGAYTLVRR